MASAGGTVDPDAMSGAGGPTPENVLTFLRLAGCLKGVERTGWVTVGVVSPESVSDHMYRMALACFVLQDEPDVDASVDFSRAVQMALVHDLTECLVGDITPHQKIPESVKNRWEREAATILRDILPGSAAGELVLELWEEYQAGVSPNIDKFEMALQAQEYEWRQGIDLRQFADSVRHRFKTPTIQRWFSTLDAQCEASRREKGTHRAPPSAAAAKSDDASAGDSSVSMRLRYDDAHGMVVSLPPSHVQDRRITRVGALGGSGYWLAALGGAAAGAAVSALVVLRQYRPGPAAR